MKSIEVAIEMQDSKYNYLTYCYTMIIHDDHMYFQKC